MADYLLFETEEAPLQLEKAQGMGGFDGWVGALLDVHACAMHVFLIAW